MIGIVEVLPIALGLVLAAAPMVVFSVVLVVKRDVSVCAGFVGGWLLGLSIACVVVLGALDVTAAQTDSSTWLSWFKSVVGIGLIVWGIRKWLGRPAAGEDQKRPRWMAAAETISAVKAVGLGFLLASVNPKNVALVVAAAVTICEQTAHWREQVLPVLVFVVVGSLGVAAPLVTRIVLGERGEAVLAAADEQLTRHTTSIMAAVLVGIGLFVALPAMAVVLGR